MYGFVIFLSSSNVSAFHCDIDKLVHLPIILYIFSTIDYKRSH